jgi:osmoprotectant transport system ATP-binding protein
LKPIKFDKVSHRYLKDYVLKNLTFEIDGNIITAIIGKSGGGKSTLIQIINGLVVPTEGRVDVFGGKLDYNKITQIRLKIGYSVQGTGLFPHMTVYENISLLGRITQMSKDEISSRVKYLMKLVDLHDEFENCYPYQLSGGQQQRVGLCRAMMLNPPVFLLDEAFAALDPTTKNEIHNELLKIQKMEPRTIVMVTHDLAEAVKLADKIMVLHQGEIQQYGTKDEILNSPANDYVRDFIKSQEAV